MRVSRAFRLVTTLSPLILATSGCRGSRPVSIAPHAIIGEWVQEPYVAAQVEFPITLVEPIEKRASHLPRTFRARVEYPVRSPENEIVIQTNAIVRGEIVDIDTAPFLLVKFKFNEIETVWGPTRLTATVRSAEPYALVSSAPMSNGPRFDAALYPLGTPLGTETSPGHAARAVGGGPRPDASSEVILPAGARMRLVLAQPVVPPRPTNAWQ
jgi:hypothetical protein